MSNTAPPRPLSAFDARGLRGVLTDIDDTLTTDGRLEPDAYAALWALHRAGLHVVPVTGRSAGWAHMILKTWPVGAVVAESGGLYLWRDGATGRVEQVFHDDPARVAADRARLADCAAAVLQAVPGLAPASDNAFRRVDLALDYCEEVPRVAPDAVARAEALFRAAGFSARSSSVHVNAWAGRFDRRRWRCAAWPSASRPAQTRRPGPSSATRRTTRRCSPRSCTASAWPTCSITARR